VAVNKPIEFNVIIIFAKRVDKDFSNFQPSDVETKLEKGTKNKKSNTQIRESDIEAMVLNQKLRLTSLTKADIKNIFHSQIQYFSIDNAHLVYNAHPKCFRHSV
jgi:hypothetical protein